MAETFSVIAQLSAVDKNFTSVFGKADRATQSLGQRIRSGLGFGILMAAGQKAFSVMSSGINEVISGMNDSAKAWKTFEGNMSYLGKSQSEIAGVKKELQSFATQTIYSASDMASTYSQLAAVGTKNTTQLVKGFGGLAAAAENPTQAMKTLSQQATQMAAKPQVAWQDFKLILEQTPAGVAAVAKEMGMSTQDMITAVQDGKVATEDFFNAIAKVGTSDTFSKMATTYQTVDQAIDGLKETLSNKLQPTFDKVSAVGIKAVENISNALEKVNIEQIISKITSRFTTLWGIFKNTGALEAVKKAATNVGNAFKTVFSALNSNGGTIELIVDAVGNLVTMFANAASAVGKFVSKLPKGVINGITTAILGSVAAFSVFHTGVGIATSAVNKFKSVKSIFTGFKKSVSGGVEGAAEMAKGGVSKIAQVINSIGGLINSIGKTIATVFQGVGKGISTAFQGIGKGLSTAIQGVGKGISTAFQGIGRGLKMVSPAQMLALGAAIAIVCAGFTLLATQGEGVATILNAVGSVLSTVISAVIGAVAQALVTVAGVVPVICSGLAQLSPLITAVGEAIGLAAPGIQAFGTAFATIIESVGNAIATVMPTITDAFTRIVPVVTSAITQIISAITPLVPNIQSIVETLAPVAMKIVDAFSKVVGQISPILDSISNLVDTSLSGIADTISSIGDTISSVVTSIGDSVSSVLDSVAGIFDSIGNAALNAGKGFDLLSNGIKRLVNLKLGDLVATLKETASGISDIAANSDGLPELGNGFNALGKGIQKAATFGTMAGTAFMLITTALAPMQASIESLPPAMAVCAGALQSFSASMLSLGIGLATSTASFTAFGATVQQLVGNMAALTIIGAVATHVMSTITSQTNRAKSTITSLGSAFTRVGTLATTASARMTQFTASVTRAGTQAVNAIRTMATQMVSAATSGLSRLSSVGSSSMAKFASGIRSGGSTATAAARSVSTNAANAMRNGYSSAYSAGTNIGRGLANGIRAMQGQVRSAAASLANAANRSITVTAQIHSPSRVTERLGKFYGEGFALGIEEKARRVAQAAKDMVQIPDLAAAGADIRLDPYARYGLGENLKEDIIEAILKRPMVIENITTLDGRVTARGTAMYTQEELEKAERTKNWINGIR